MVCFRPLLAVIVILLYMTADIVPLCHAQGGIDSKDKATDVKDAEQQPSSSSSSDNTPSHPSSLQVASTLEAQEHTIQLEATKQQPTVLLQKARNLFYRRNYTPQPGIDNLFGENKTSVLSSNQRTSTTIMQLHGRLGSRQTNDKLDLTFKNLELQTPHASFAKPHDNYSELRTNKLHALTPMTTAPKLDFAFKNLQLQTAHTSFGKPHDNYSQLRTDELLAVAPIPKAPDAIPGVLRDRLYELSNLALRNPDLAMSFAASTYERWDDPLQSEFIFDRIVDIAQQQSAGRGIEMTMIIIRRFAQQIKSEELSRRAQLRMGRLYYDHGDYAKASMELPVDVTLQTPTRYDSIAGLVKAISLIRIGKTSDAFRYLEWVARHTVDDHQRARSSFLLGRLHLLYKRKGKARDWLHKVAYELADEAYVAEAKKLLAQIKD